MTRRAPALALVLVLALGVPLASCLESETVSCEFGVVCPKGLRCEPIHQTCVRPGEPVCGNREREDGEQCDDGPANSDEERDACRTDCTLAHCGDRVVDSGEVCDFGADVGAGCSPDCRSTEVCGNAYVDAGIGERCDDGNLKSGDGCDGICQPELLGWWEPTVTSAPSGQGAMAYDARRGVMVFVQDVLNLSSPVVPGYDHVVFELDGAQWGARRASASRRLSDIAVAYDPGREAVVIVGSGQDGCESWTYDGGQWRPVEGPALPSCYGPALTYDGNLSALLLVAGPGGNAWRLDADGWHALGVDLPFGDRRDAALAFDPVLGRSVLFGGFDADDATWLFDGTLWTPAETVTRPAPRSGATMTWDAARQRLVMYGGLTPPIDSLGETWVFAANDWSLLDDGIAVGRRGAHGMAYDPARGVVLVVGGSCASSVSEFSPPPEVECGLRPFELAERWAPALDISGPGPRRASAATFAPTLGATVVFGGVALDDAGGDGVLLGDTWVGRADRWELWSDPAGPAPRRDAQLAFDSRRGRVVLFGGAGVGGAPLADTWELGPDGWVRGPDVGGPSARHGHALAYDRQRGRVVLYGGRDASQVFADRWEYDGAAWSEVESAAPPGPRFDAAMTYDAARRLLVIYGGRTSLSELAPSSQTTWELGDTWRQYPLPFESSSSRHQLVFDEARARVVMVRAGIAVTGFPESQICAFFDCFAISVLELGAIGWIQRIPLGQVPRSASRDLSHVVFDAEGGRIVLAERSGWVLAYRGEVARASCDSGPFAVPNPIEICARPDCAAFPPCTAEACDDPSADLDGDGLSGCADPGCGGSLCGLERRCIAGVCGCDAAQFEDVCDDGQDQDCDELIDCADPDCRNSTKCAVGCKDGDGDGHGAGRDCLGTDCNDGDASVFRSGLYYRDTDGDGVGTPKETRTCVGADEPAGFAIETGDCNDADADCVSGACCPVCEDRDGDGHGVGANCAGPDCDDSDPGCHAAGDACCDVLGQCFDTDGDGAGYISCARFDCNDTEASCETIGDACCAGPTAPDCVGCGCAALLACALGCGPASCYDACAAAADAEAQALVVEIQVCAQAAGCFAPIDQPCIFAACADEVAACQDDAR